MTVPAPPPEPVALVSCMRNEGIFVLEWLAYHLGLGFERIVVVSNDCTDGSDRLLDQLQARGLITHIRQNVPEGTAPQDQGMPIAMDRLRQEGIAWLLHIDSDEFLLIETGDGRLADLMPKVAGADVAALPWRMFGDAGLTDWRAGANVLEANTRAEYGPIPGVTRFKCLFRLSSFARATDHNPLDPLVENPRVVTPDGRPLMNRTLYNARSSRFRPDERACGARAARINHYAIKSEDLFLMKNDRGCGQGKPAGAKYVLGGNWHVLANRNEVEDRAILRHWPETAARLVELRADPETAALESASRDWFIARRDAVLTAANRAAWTRKTEALA
ncbi:glycosyltransferase family 2 protein [Albidovulum sediminicola]|uniref:Glycosyltransferase family 2 protein n=1 Tax=Albidovulum sediminicola TaxID=2984331 RepID=A0ABT2Z2G8_9RHOB|nr:glycosyltransferase family 2 protein [Defluviimonas sp. WL0075]MCV2865339.1 glycosyltransferase family 2 protein [Defluviimonas sp. WL0075]